MMDQFTAVTLRFFVVLFKSEQANMTRTKIQSNFFGEGWVLHIILHWSLCGIVDRRAVRYGGQNPPPCGRRQRKWRRQNALIFWGSMWIRNNPFRHIVSNRTIFILWWDNCLEMSRWKNGVLHISNENWRIWRGFFAWNTNNPANFSGAGFVGWQ